MNFFVKDKAFYRSFFTLTFVIALQNLIAFSVNLADSIMLGSYSEIALSGAAVCNQIQFLLQVCVNGIVTGLVVISAQYWGKKQTKPIKKTFAVAFWFAVTVSVALTVLCLFVPDGILRLITNEEAVIAQGVEYLKIVCCSYVIFAITTVLLGALRSVETVKVGFWVSFLALFVNVGLNYLLIYGKAGFSAMGIKGAALATLLARVFELAAVSVYAALIDKKLKLRIKDIFSVEKSYILDFKKTGLPTVLSGTSWGIAMGVQGAILGRLGASTIAASSIATTIFQVAVVVAGGSANASNIIIGKAVGEGDLSKVKQYAKTMQVLFLGIGLGTSALLLAGKAFVIDLYNASAETAALTGSFILVLCVTVIGTAYQMPSLTGIVAGGGDTKFVLLNDIIFMWMMVLPLSAISAFILKLPVVVTFALLKSDQIAKCFVAVVKVNRFGWIRILTRKEAA